MKITRHTFLREARKVTRTVAGASLLSVSALWIHAVLTPRLPTTHFLSSRLSYYSSSQAETSTAPLHHPVEVQASVPASTFPSPVSSSPHSQPPLLVLHWTQHDNFHFRLRNRSFAGCPVNNCVGTGDRSLLMTADAVLIHGNRMKMQDLPQRRLPNQRYVFVMRESAQNVPLPLKKLDGLFNLTMTFSRHADVVFPYYFQTADGAQEGSLPPFESRRGERPVAWMVSNCDAKSQRNRYVSQLQSHIPVDIFGRCGDKKCNISTPDCYRRFAEMHLFYLAFENTLCEDYITEKFWLALKAGLVPVVRGPPPESYRRVAPPHSFIHVEEFAGPKALARYLLSLAQNRTEYERYHAWRRSHRVRSPNLCDLCRRLGREGSDPAVKLSEVWSPERLCRQPRDVDMHDKLAHSSDRKGNTPK